MRHTITRALRGVGVGVIWGEAGWGGEALSTLSNTPPTASQNNTLYSIVPLGCVLASFLSGEVGGGRDEASRAPEAVKMRGSLWPSAASIVCCRPMGVMTGSELSGAFSVRAGVLLTSCGGSTYHLVIFSPWLSPTARNSTGEWWFL